MKWGSLIESPGFQVSNVCNDLQPTATRRYEHQYKIRFNSLYVNIKVNFVIENILESSLTLIFADTIRYDIIKNIN